MKVGEKVKYRPPYAYNVEDFTIFSIEKGIAQITPDKGGRRLRVPMGVLYPHVKGLSRTELDPNWKKNLLKRGTKVLYRPPYHSTAREFTVEGWADSPSGSATLDLRNGEDIYRDVHILDVYPV